MDVPCPDASGGESRECAESGCKTAVGTARIIVEAALLQQVNRAGREWCSGSRWEIGNKSNIDAGSIPASRNDGGGVEV